MKFSSVVLMSLVTAFGNLDAAEGAVNMQDPLHVVQAYVRATYARDFVDAYRLISAADRSARDLNRYVQQRGAFGGFTLEAAKKLSDSIEITGIQKQETPSRIQAVIKYRVPDPKKLAPLLFNWDPFRLNSLSATERKQLLDALDKRQQERSLEMSEGEEKFELVKEANEWRVFLNWAAGVKVPVKIDLTKTTELDVSVSKNEFIIQPGDVFELSLRIKNKTQQPLTARIGHIVDPQNISDYLDFVQCGFLLPVTIQGGKESEYFGTYMVRGSLPEGVRQLNLTYDFRILK